MTQSITASDVARWLNEHKDQFQVYHSRRYGGHVDMFPLDVETIQYVIECDAVLFVTMSRKPPTEPELRQPGVRGEDHIKEPEPKPHRGGGYS